LIANITQRPTFTGHYCSRCGGSSGGKRLACGQADLLSFQSDWIDGSCYGRLAGIHHKIVVVVVIVFISNRGLGGLVTFVRLGMNEHTWKKVPVLAGFGCVEWKLVETCFENCIPSGIGSSFTLC
jgi:hypothetical protein